MPSKSMSENEYHTEFDWQDRGLHFGDGLFETLLKFNQQVPLWDEHYNRLVLGCQRLSISAPAKNWLHNRIVEESKTKDNAVIKIIVTRGRGGRGLELPEDPQPSVFVLSYPWSRPMQQEHVLSICKTRLPIDPTLAGLKHLNRMNYVLAAIELAKNPAASEGILCDSEGFVVEGLISNLFFMNQSGLHTPSLEYAGVDGIMRQLIIQQAKNIDLPFSIGRYTQEDLFAASECFLCNSVRGITPVVAIDQHLFNVGECTQNLMAALNMTE